MSSLPPRRTGVSLAVAMSTAIFISGCAPSGEEDSSVSANSNSANGNGSSNSLDIVAGNAIVSKQTLGASDSPSECAAGGVKLSWGNDTNDNNTLDADEIVQSVNVCNGVNGTDGLAGQNGSNGQDGKDGVDGQNGAAGQNGADGKDGASAHFKVESALTSACSAGGQTITVGLNDGSGGFLDGSTKSFTICNGVDGTGSNTDVTADKIAQGKTLVENTKGYIDALVSNNTYVNYLNDMDGVFADQDAQALYDTLAGLIKVSFDALYTNEVTDYAAFIASELADVEGVDTSNMTAVETNGVLSISGLLVNGVTVNGFSFEYAGHQDNNGTDSVDRFEVKSLDMVSGETTLSLASESDVSFEVRLATGSSSLATLEQYADFGSDAAIQSWRDNVTFNVNDNSAATLSLEGVVLGMDSSTNPSSFQGDIGLSFALTESAFENGFPVLDFGSLMLSGAMTNPFGKSFEMALDVDFADDFIPVDPMDNTADSLELVAETAASTLMQGIPVTWGSYVSEWGQSYDTATVDYAFLLNSVENSLGDDAEVTKVHTDNEWFKKVVEYSYCDKVVKEYSQDHELLWESSNSACYSSSIYNAVNEEINQDSVVFELSNGYHLEFNYDTPYDMTLSSSSTVIPTSYIDYNVVRSNKNASIDRLVFTMSSDVEKEQNFKFEITELSLDDEYYNPASYSSRTELEGMASVSLNDDAIKAVFPIWLDVFPEYQVCRESSLTQTSSGDFSWCLGEGAKLGADREEIKLHFTDNSGGAFDIIFQERAYDERFSAYVTVSGTPVGKLVQYRDGRYAVEFRDGVRVPLTDN